MARAVNLALPELLRPHVAEALPSDVAVTWYGDGTEVAAAACDAEVLYVHFWAPSQISTAIDGAPHLQWVAATAAGVDFLPLATMRERGITLTSGAGLPTIPVAEFAVLCVLSAAKNLPALVRAHDQHMWKQAPGRAELYQSRALIVGYGAIGRAVGTLLQAFGAEVTGVRRDPGGAPGVIGPDAWRPGLGRYDWVILAAASTSETRGMIGRAELAAMRPSAYLVNIARGALVDEAALADALHAGEIAGAYLDVTSTEPLPPEHPLWTAPNAIISGHSSGAATTRMAERAGALFLENLDRYRRAETLRNTVDLTRGY